MLELGAGQPGPETLPAELISDAATDLLARSSFGALAYGVPGGPAPLREQIATRLGRYCDVDLDPAALVITGGTSLALDQILAGMTRPGQTVLVEGRTYDLALPIFRDHGLDVHGVPFDEDGIVVDAIPAIVASLRRAGADVQLLYCVPTFHNPTGRTLSVERRRALADVLDQERIVALEDDPYREIAFDQSCPPPLWALARRGRVIWLGSFSKTLAPGLRLGWLVADRESAARMARAGAARSGGGVNHFAAMVVSELLRTESYARHVAELRATYRARRDAVIATLRSRLPANCSLDPPGGGFFVWLELPGGADADMVRRRAEDAGVSCYDSRRFTTMPGLRPALRLSYSFCTTDQLVDASARIAAVVAT